MLIWFLPVFLIFLMIGILLMDAVTRNVIDIPVHWAIEAAQFTLAAYYFMGGAMTLKNNEHVRMDLFYHAWSDQRKAWFDAFTVFFLVFYLGVLLYGALDSTQYAIEYKERSYSAWRPYMWPIKVIMTTNPDTCRLITSG